MGARAKDHGATANAPHWWRSSIAAKRAYGWHVVAVTAKRGFMRLPFIGRVANPAPDPAREHADGLEQMIAAELPRAAANQRALQATRAEEAKRQRAEDRAV